MTGYLNEIDMGIQHTEDILLLRALCSHILVDRRKIII